MDELFFLNGEEYKLKIFSNDQLHLLIAEQLVVIGWLEQIERFSKKKMENEKRKRFGIQVKDNGRKYSSELKYLSLVKKSKQIAGFLNLKGGGSPFVHH